MFGKTNDPAALPSAAAKTPAKSVLAFDLQIKGTISSTGTVEILGSIDGDVSAKMLIVGVEGRLQGTITAQQVDLLGTFVGTIATQGLTLRSSCEVTAQMRYTSLSIETGAAVDGTFKRNPS